jgi:1-acylglycerone phosphate reductase
MPNSSLRGDRICTDDTGLHVIATARNQGTIADLEAMGMSTLSLDVTSSESIAAAKKEVEVLGKGKLDILVNNA